MTHSPDRSQQGFTLMEVVAVLFILGILVAFAASRYFSMQAQARNHAAQTAVSEAKARVAQLGGLYLLQNSGWPAASYYTGAQIGTGAGDFTLSVATSGDSVSITATGVAGGPSSGGTASGSMLRPGVT